MPPPPLYVFDTNILIHSVRGGAVWGDIKSKCNPLMTEPCPLVSIVTHGELRSFAAQREWGQWKQEQAAFLLDYFVRVDVTVDVTSEVMLQTYAEIDTWSRRRSVRMGKNDLWIAATAAVADAILVTTDRDFDHLHGVFFSRLLIPL